MDEFKILLKAIVDAKDTQAQLNAIKNLSVKIEKLNLDQSAITELRNQLSKNGIDVNLVLGNTNQLQNQAKQTGQQIGAALNTAIKTTMRPLSELKTGTGNIAAVFDKNGLLDVEASLNKIKQTYAEFGQVKITNKLFDSDGNIESFRVNIEQVNGDLKETRNFMMAINGTSFTFPDDIIKGSESIVQHLDKTKNAINQTGEAINLLKSNAASDKIQLSIGNGDFETKMLGYETALKKLGLSSEEIALKMQGVKSAYNKLSTSAKGDNIIPDDVVAKAATLNTEMSKLSNITKQIRLKESLNADQLQVDQTVVRLNEQLRKNTAYSKEAKSKIQAWIDELARGNVAEARLRQINSKAKQLHANMASLNKVGFLWTDKLKNAWSKFGGWSLASTSLMKLVYEAKEGIKFIGELDDAMTDVAYTSNVTKSQLIDLGNSSVSMAKNLNTSAKNVLEAVKIYSTANSTADDILRKAQPAIILSNVSGMSGSESSKTIQTSLNQFELEDTESSLLDIVDTLEYVSSQLNYDFTDGIKEITEGIEASGNVAKNAGLNMQEYATMVGLAVEKTGQGGSTIGNAYKTIFSRITKASSTEGTLEDDISAAEKSLRSIGIEVRDTENEFKDLSQTMSEIGKVWDSLSSVEKSNVGFNVAGTRQLNVLNSLFSSWESYEKIIGNIDERSGMAMKNQEEYAESLQGHLGELVATGQSVWNNLLDSSELKTGVDLLTGLLTIIDKLTSELGGLGTIGLGAGIFGITAFIKNLDCQKVLKIA